jgi:excisionase family DNA binding protein
MNINNNREFMTTKEAAELWNLQRKITPEKIARLCREGKLPNAKKSGGFWRIPRGTKYPL